MSYSGSSCRLRENLCDTPLSFNPCYLYGISCPALYRLFCLRSIHRVYAPPRRIDVATWNVAIAGELIMRKQLGKTQPVRGKSSRKSAHDSGKTKSNVSSKPLVQRKRRAYVPSAAGAPVPEGSTTPTEGDTITLPSCALVLPENQAYVPSAAAAVIEGSTTPMEEDTTTLVLRALVLRKNQANVPDAAAAVISQGWTSALEKYWGREIIDKEKALTIMMIPFMAWHAYQTRLQRRRNAMQMLVRGCVVRPADVELHYMTSVRKLGIGIEAPDSQPFRDMELTFCPVPLAAEMRARGKQLLQWLRHELAAKYLPKLWKVVKEETGGATFWLAKPTKPRTGRKRTHSLVQ